MYELTVFNYGDNAIRTQVKDGNTLWALVDICRALELSNPSAVAQRLDDDEWAKLDLGRSEITGGGGETLFVTESGLYAVILRSDKPEAKKFRKWVTSEVLPSIRKTGSYSLTEKEKTARASVIAKTPLNRLHYVLDIYDMKVTEPIPTIQQHTPPAIADSFTKFLKHYTDFNFDKMFVADAYRLYLSFCEEKAMRPISNITFSKCMVREAKYVIKRGQRNGKEAKVFIISH